MELLLPLRRGISWKRLHVSVPVDQRLLEELLVFCCWLQASFLHTHELTLFLVDMET